MVDWSKAGVRIRRTPETPAMGGRNPDWDFRNERWKDAADYAGEAMSAGEVTARVPCPICTDIAGRFCHDVRGERMDHPHPQRVRAAGQQELEENGPSV